MSNVRQRNLKSSLKGASGNTANKPSLLQKVRFAVDDVIFNRSARDTNIHRIEEMLIWPYVVTFFAFLTLSVYFVNYLNYDGDVIASAQDDVHFLFNKVKCSNDYDKKFTECSPKFCGRAVQDDLFDEVELKTMKGIAEKGMKYGGGSGGATILDLHTGALSYKDKFINIYKVEKNLFSPADKDTYKRIKNKIRDTIAQTFKINRDRLYLTNPTFFSQLTNATAVTSHDEYWHPHIDRVTYGTFYYTSLLYLTTHGEDFEGGRFMFVDVDGKNKSVEPRLGRLSYFSSGSENKHFVERVASGARFAVTVSFTCESKHKINDPAFV